MRPQSDREEMVGWEVASSRGSAHLSPGRSPSRDISPDKRRNHMGLGQGSRRGGAAHSYPPSETAPGAARGQAPLHPRRARSVLAEGPVGEAGLADSRAGPPESKLVFNKHM